MLEDFSQTSIGEGARVIFFVRDESMTSGHCAHGNRHFQLGHKIGLAGRG